MPDEDGYPDYEAFKCSIRKTAAFFVANPEDTGVFNQELRVTDLVRKAGGLNCYDQANANGLWDYKS